MYEKVNGIAGVRLYCRATQTTLFPHVALVITFIHISPVKVATRYHGT